MSDEPQIDGMAKSVRMLLSHGMTQKEVSVLLGLPIAKVSNIHMGKTSADYQRDWRERNPARAKEIRTKYHRQNVLVVRGKATVVRKRPRPVDTCELCGDSFDRLNYHHWDDDAPHLGIWVCFMCHQLVEAVDKGFVEGYLERYKELKLSINETVEVQ